MSKKFLPGMAKGFFSPKLTLHIGDGFEFMKQNQDAFDIIITDSSDPVGRCCLKSRNPCVSKELIKQHKYGTRFNEAVSIRISLIVISGPAESLFKESYYQLMKAALRSGGIICSQGKFIFHWTCALKAG